MKKVLVLGAGFVTRPLVCYLLKQPEIQVTVADRIKPSAQKLIDNHPRGTARQLDAQNTEALIAAVNAADIVISMLPFAFHPKVAGICLEYKKHLVTTSYVKPEMKALDGRAKEKGLLLLNEIGADPGMDHMAAMRVIHKIQNAAGKIVAFYSYGTSLPAPPHNNNPLGYKFAWSPTGVLLVATNPGRYVKNGEIVEVSAGKLFEHYWFVDIPGVGVFESFVNRDALPYIDLYRIPSTKDMYRGTLRNVGSCETWHHLKKLGLLNRQRRFDFQKVTPRDVIRQLIKSDGKNIITDTAAFLQISEHSTTIKKFEWLGLFSDQKLEIGKTTLFDMLAHILQDKLVYREGETDLLILHHDIVAQYPGKSKEKISSTLAAVGIPYGDTATARVVSLPAAIAARLILEEKLKLTGVHIPILPEIYKPVLAELETLDIKIEERRKTLEAV